MQKKNCFTLGRVVKKHSFRGEVVVKVDDDFLDFVNDLESVWLELKGHLVPFFIEAIRQTGVVFFRVKFEGVDSEQEANEIIGSDVFVPKDEVEIVVKQDLVEYCVVDEKLGEVGKVHQINTHSPQPIIEVLKLNNEILLIPFHEDLVLNIDRATQIISVDLPEGLLDL